MSANIADAELSAEKLIRTFAALGILPARIQSRDDGVLVAFSGGGVSEIIFPHLTVHGFQQVLLRIFNATEIKP